MATAAVLLLQGSAMGTPSRHMRWQREIVVPTAGGPVCVVLNAQVLAHTESRSGDDLRVYRQDAAGESEVPFSLMESGAEPEETDAATLHNKRVRGNAIDFDMTMPRRVYSSVVLKVAAKDFVGRALVTAKEGGAVLGSFAVFDLSGEGLARSTTLAMAETEVPEVHVSLRLTGVGRHDLRVTEGMVEGAEAPASREAQTLYTVVATTRSVQMTRHGTQVGAMMVPAHVPVERVRVILDPGFRGEFEREVRIGGVRERSVLRAEESVRGSIWRVSRPSVGGGPAIAAESLSVDAVLGLTLREAATVHVEVNDVRGNLVLPPLPIREVQLEMRQRSVCFESERGAKYLLRYGDAGLGAPVYKQVEAVALGQGAMTTPGPESESLDFQPGAATPHTLGQRVGLIWIVSLGGLMLLWASVHGWIRRRGGRA